MVTTLRLPGDPAKIVDEAEAKSVRDYWKIEMTGLTQSRGGISIDISGRTISPCAAKVFAKFLLAFADRVIEVNFSSILDGLALPEALSVLQVLVGSLEGSPLVTLDCSHNAIGGNGGLEKLEPVLTKTTLCNLYLCDNGLGGDDVERLYEFLSGSNVPLKLLHLSRNAIGDAGAEYFGFIVETVLTLVDVEYVDNRPGTEGSEAIAQALSARATYDKRNNDTANPMTRLNFEGSFFSVDGGFDTLIAAMRKLKLLESLQYVNLNYCDIHKSGREKLQRILGDIDGIELLLEEEDLDSDEEEDVIEDFSQMHF